MNKITSTFENIYDYPHYYDLVFGSDWKAEYDFLVACFERHAKRPVRRVFEPACGTGRLLGRMGKAGYEVGGNDLNPKAIDYCNRRLRRWGVEGTVEVGDMANFRLKRKVDASFNTINSFRHLSSQAAAESHLACVAASLAKGGIYVLGLHLTPTKGKPLGEESWAARRGHLTVISRLWTVEVNLRRRQERVGMTFDIYKPSGHRRLEDETIFRTYKAAQMMQLLHSVSDLELAAIYDFSYCIDEPIEIGPATEDVVFVLRKT